MISKYINNNRLLLSIDWLGKLESFDKSFRCYSIRLNHSRPHLKIKVHHHSKDRPIYQPLLQNFTQKLMTYKHKNIKR